MNTVFDWCVKLLVFLAPYFGMTYKEINVWIFVIIWPFISITMAALIIVQHFQIRKLRGFNS